MPDQLDDEIRRRARAARTEVEAGVDSDPSEMLAGDPALIAERHDDPTLAGTGARPNRRLIAVGGSIAAAVVAIIGGVVLLGQSDDTIETADPATTTVEPTPDTTMRATTAPATTGPTTTAITEAPKTTSGVLTSDPPSSTTPPSAAGSISCTTNDPTATVERIRDAVLAARATGTSSDIADCIGVVPEEFDGKVPACWFRCESFEREIHVGTVNAGFGGIPPAIGEDRSFALYISYRMGGEIIDVLEGWSFDVTDGGVEFAGVSFGEMTLYTRDEAIDTLDTYLGHLRRSDWWAAAAMHNDGAVNSEERSDLARLDLGGDFSIESIARGLETWCRNGCVLQTPAPDELAWDGFYGIRIGDEALRVAWFEGDRSIVGLPLRLVQPQHVITTASWRDLANEGARIDRECDEGDRCIPLVAVGRDGTTVTVGDGTVQRLDRPTTTATVPNASYVAALGPGEIAYVAVDGAEELSTDIVAISLAARDAGRVIRRWASVLDQSGDSELVAARDGLVVVGCCGPDTVRPDPAAKVVVPWVDETGESAESIRPTIRVEIEGTRLIVSRENRLSAGTRTWEVDLGDTWPQRGMPAAMPTFDGGVVLATDGVDGVTITRTWIDGSFASVLLTDAVEVSLDPSGRVIVPDDTRFARVDPFPNRGWVWADRPIVDVENATAELPGIDELARENDWGVDPVAFADVVVGPPAVNERRTIDVERTGADTFVATATTSNFFDDSVFATRFELELERDGTGRFAVVSVDWSNSCQPNRGHQDFRADLCS